MGKRVTLGAVRGLRSVQSGGRGEGAGKHGGAGTGPRGSSLSALQFGRGRRACDGKEDGELQALLFHIRYVFQHWKLGDLQRGSGSSSELGDTAPGPGGTPAAGVYETAGWEKKGRGMSQEQAFGVHGTEDLAKSRSGTMGVALRRDSCDGRVTF